MSYSTITGMRSARYPLQGVTRRATWLHPAFRPSRTRTGVVDPDLFRGLKERGAVVPPLEARGFAGCGCGCAGMGSCGSLGQDMSGAVPGVLVIGAFIAGLLWMGTRGQATATR